MKLRKVLIENFRGIRRLELVLDDTTVLIGENNSGKTAVLDALRLCLREMGSRKRVVFDPYDFYLKDANADPASADSIRIEITFSEDGVGQWGDQLTASLTRLRILQVDDYSCGHIILSVKCAFDTKTGDLDQDWEFLNLNGDKLQNVPDTALAILQREVSYYYLSALRDAAKHFDPKGPFWRPFLKDSQLTPEKRAEIEAKLREINDLVVQSHSSFDQAKECLRRIQDVVPMSSGDVVSVEAVPGRLFDMLSKAQIHLGTGTGAKVPIGRHGEGTQSLAVLMLFSAFLEAWPGSASIVALEEPEAHLHPSAVRALWKLINDIAGQKLISTHSGDLLSEVPIRSVRRLVREPNGAAGYFLKPTTLTPDEERKFNFHIRYARAELLFARCWILVEGETEITLLPELAQMLGLDMERVGIRCVPFQHAGLEVFLKVANDFGIRWCVLSDNDQQGISDQKKVVTHLKAAKLEDVLHVMPQPDIEQYLCACGFGSVYLSYLTAQTQKQVTAAPSEPDYWRQATKAVNGARNYSKPSAALHVVSQIRNGVAGIPAILKQTMLAASRLAEM